MPKKISILFLIILLVGLFFPALILAGDYQVDGGTVHYEGLVPCGGANQPACQFCHLFVMLAGIIDFVLFDILPLVAILMIVIGGVMFFTAVGNPAKISQATSLLTAVAIGLVIIYSAYLIVGAVLSATGVLGWTTLDKWFSQGSFTVNCPIGEDGVVGNGVNGVNGENGENGEEDWDEKESVQGQYPNCEVEGIAECKEGQKAENGKCEPGENTNITTDPISKKTDDGKGWYCKFTAEFKPALGYLECYVPTGTIYVNCIDDPDYVPSVESSSTTDPFGADEQTLTLDCETGQTFVKGSCILTDPITTTITDRGSSNNGYFCTFLGINTAPGGKITIECTEAATLSYYTYKTTDDFVTTEVNSVPSNLTIVGDDVYSVVSQEDTKTPAIITLPYTDEWVTSAGLDENTLAIYRYDEILSRWVGLPSTVDKVNNTVTALTDRLSIFAIMGRKATVTDCECTSGPCCDGCHYYGTDYDCYIDSEPKYSCPWGTGCGDDVGVTFRRRTQYCSGESAKCNGSFSEWGDWDDDWIPLNKCDSNQVCDSNSLSCEYSKNCGCQCLKGDECCSDGCHYNADGTVCWSGIETGCMLCEWDSEDKCNGLATGKAIRKIKTCDNGKCSFAGYEESVCGCIRDTEGYLCAVSSVTCVHDTSECSNCPDNYCKKVLKYRCDSSGECDMSNPFPFFWGECCYPIKECKPGTTCCTDEGYYEEEGKICLEYDWEECAGGEYTSECDNIKIGSQTKKTMACNRTGGCNMILPWEYRDCPITRNTDGISCTITNTITKGTDGISLGEGEGYCEAGVCGPPEDWEFHPEQECTPGTSCCTSDGQYKAEGTRCYTDSTWGTCITDWDTASDCQESITGEWYKQHKTCDASGSCSVKDEESETCTDTRDTDGDYCGSAGIYLRHCKNGECVTDEPAYGDECDPLSTCCTSGGYYESSGTRCYTDDSWSSCSDCDYHGSCDEKADGTAEKTHKNCNDSGSCSVIEKEETDCTCTRDTDGDRCKPGSPNDCFCYAGSCKCYGPEE